MRVGEIRTLAGPNVYSFRPVLSMKLYLDDLSGKESREFPGFNELLLEALPGLAKHHCCMEREGGFAERLREGTYFGHIVEHVALELTELSGIGKTHGKTRHDSGSFYNVAIEFRAEKASTYLLEQSCRLVQAVLRNRAFDVKPVLEKERAHIYEYDFGR